MTTNLDEKNQTSNKNSQQTPNSSKDLFINPPRPSILRGARNNPKTSTPMHAQRKGGTRSIHHTSHNALVSSEPPSLP